MNLTTSTPQNSAPLTMTSREIAELTGKEHFNVTRDIREMFESLEIDAFSFEGIYLDILNREQDCYSFPKTDRSPRKNLPQPKSCCTIRSGLEVARIRCTILLSHYWLNPATDV